MGQGLYQDMYLDAAPLLFLQGIIPLQNITIFPHPKPLEAKNHYFCPLGPFPPSFALRIFH
jgi:hypothetical protein